MTEEERPAPEGTAHPAPDPHLEILLRLVEAQPEASMAICLTTPGGIVGGHLVAAISWAKRWEESVVEAGEQRQAGPMAQLPQMLEVVQRQIEPPDGGLHPFLHLVDVTFMSVPGAPTSAVWRGRVSDVSGWSLGAPS